jgi:hypothetical protein
VVDSIRSRAVGQTRRPCVLVELMPHSVNVFSVVPLRIAVFDQRPEATSPSGPVDPSSVDAIVEVSRGGLVRVKQLRPLRVCIGDRRNGPLNLSQLVDWLYQGRNLLRVGRLA